MAKPGKIHSLPPKPPKEFWEDIDWAYDHLAELSQMYPNQWVAVVNKKVVAFGKVVGEVKRIAKEKTGKSDVPVILAERGIHVY